MNPLHVNISYARGRETLARSQVLRRTWPVVMDLCVAAIGLAIFYAIVRIAMLWAGPPSEQMVVSLSPRALPQYAFYSVVRIFLAYVLSLVFAVSYGYLAAYNKRLEAFMIAALDIMQSIPVLSFLPPVMLAMIALFPTRHLGVELGAMVLLFTGAVWNMAFSFYSSLKSIPRELREAAATSTGSRAAAAGATGAAVCGDRTGVEFDYVGGGRMVHADGLRDVSLRDEGLSAARAGIVLADRGGPEEWNGDCVGTGRR